MKSNIPDPEKSPFTIEAADIMHKLPKQFFATLVQNVNREITAGAGWRVGFALGNEKIISLINQLQDHIYVSLFGAIQEAAKIALTASQQNVADLVSLYENRRNTLFNALNEIGWEAAKPSGSFFAWLPVPKPWDSAAFAQKLLEEAKVAVAPGIGFGQHGEGYVRVGLLSDPERLKEAVMRIGKLGLF
ncbi:Aminotransferase class I and II [Fontibacillus panacisegetis]|uniref:Aminotransferase class I and II n=1 Tax=Fontibacillus panacisegetis TaxID=670482 RepID=A0A1G7KWW0_9BACL|nr:Aminotransferase class I and II [Fontibacillus panacisegetis]